MKKKLELIATVIMLVS